MPTSEGTGDFEQSFERCVVLGGVDARRCAINNGMARMKMQRMVGCTWGKQNGWQARLRRCSLAGKVDRVVSVALLLGPLEYRAEPAARIVQAYTTELKVEARILLTAGDL